MLGRNHATTPETRASTDTATIHSRRRAARAWRQQSRVWRLEQGTQAPAEPLDGGIDQAEQHHQLQQGQVHRPLEGRRVDELVDPEAVPVGEADDHRADQDHDEVGHAVDGVRCRLPQHHAEFGRLDDGDRVTGARIGLRFSWSDSWRR